VLLLQEFLQHQAEDTCSLCECAQLCVWKISYPTYMKIREGKGRGADRTNKENQESERAVRHELEDKRKE